jgi:hypothetical protein
MEVEIICYVIGWVLSWWLWCRRLDYTDWSPGVVGFVMGVCAIGWIVILPLLLMMLAIKPREFRVKGD